jgi:exonuclease III
MWNIQGLGKPARMRQLSELIIKEKVDVVGVQETIKQSFSLRELQRLNQGESTVGSGCQQLATLEGSLWG